MECTTLQPSYYQTILCLFQSPAARDETASIADDSSSVGNKEEDDDDDEEDTNDENFDGINRDPERLKAFNVSIYKVIKVLE